MLNASKASYLPAVRRVILAVDSVKFGSLHDLHVSSAGTQQL